MYVGTKVGLFHHYLGEGAVYLDEDNAGGCRDCLAVAADYPSAELTSVSIKEFSGLAVKVGQDDTSVATFH